MQYLYEAHGKRRVQNKYICYGKWNKYKSIIKKKEFRPESMTNMGIGHNVLYVDHVTTVHIIPLTFENTLFGYSEIMAIICRDYGVDQDAECMITKGKPDLLIKGENINIP